MFTEVKTIYIQLLIEVFFTHALQNARKFLNAYLCGIGLTQ